MNELYYEGMGIVFGMCFVFLFLGVNVLLIL